MKMALMVHLLANDKMFPLTKYKYVILYIFFICLDLIILFYQVQAVRNIINYIYF